MKPKVAPVTNFKDLKKPLLSPLVIAKKLTGPGLIDIDKEKIAIEIIIKFKTLLIKQCVEFATLFCVRLDALIEFHNSNAEVIQQGSFRKAGRALSLSPSVISYHNSQLEDKLGSALIYRSTRKLTLSYEGELFYQQVLKMLDAASQGIELLSRNQTEPSGKISLSLPTALSNSALNHRIARFALKYPKVKLDIS